MRRSSSSLFSATAIAASLFAFVQTTSAFAAPATLRYRITVENVTAGNRLSPFFTAVLRKGVVPFTLGKPASAGVQSIAETGSTAAIESEYTGNPNLITMAHAAGSPLVPGSSVSVEIAVPVGAVVSGATLNVLAMIGMSNDSFISVRALPLSSIGWSPTTIGATNYDAGSEENTGNIADFGAGGHPVAAAEGLVSIDRGLNPRGDAPEIIGWGATAGIVRISRIE